MKKIFHGYFDAQVSELYANEKQILKESNEYLRV